MRAKSNFRLPANLDERAFQRARQGVADWHWYEAGEFDNQLRMIDWDDPDYPPGALISCGNFARVHFRAPSTQRNRHPRRRRDTTITLNRKAAQHSWLAFDPEHRDYRLYILLAPEAKEGLSQRFWRENPLQPKPLAQWAMMSGGRHSRGGYPAVRAKPVGIMTAVVYFTDKRDDGPSFYIHRMGEMSCVFPILVCDEKGRLWVCGGSYRSPTPGITD